VTKYVTLGVKNSKNPVCLAPLLNTDISAMIIGPCYQNFSGNVGKASSTGYIRRKAAERWTQDHVAWLQFWPCLIPSWSRASRTIGGCWKSWNIWSSHRIAVPAALDVKIIQYLDELSRTKLPLEFLVWYTAQFENNAFAVQTYVAWQSLSNLVCFSGKSWLA